MFFYNEKSTMVDESCDARARQEQNYAELNIDYFGIITRIEV